MYAWHWIRPVLHTRSDAAVSPLSPVTSLAVPSLIEGAEALPSSSAHEGLSPRKTPRASLEMPANIPKLVAKSLEERMCNGYVINLCATQVAFPPTCPHRHASGITVALEWCIVADESGAATEAKHVAKQVIVMRKD